MKNIIKKILDKIPFKIVTIFLMISFLISIGIAVFLNKGLGLLILLIIYFLGIVEFILFSLKQVIDDMDKIIGSMAFVAWIVILVTGVGNAMIKYVPKYFPDNKEEMYQLYIASFTTIISATLGILGTYFGAIYGGKKSLEAVEKQIAKQEEDIRNKEKENKEIAIRIITKFLKEEILDNKNHIEDVNLYECIDNGFGTQYLHYLNRKIKFDSYEEIKYELIKYTTEKLVEDVIDLYELFYLLARYNDLNKLNEKEYNKLSNLEFKLENLIENIESKNS